MQIQGPHYFSVHNGKIENSSMRDVLNILFRRKNAFLLFFGGVFLAVLLITYITPEIYQSEAKILIRVGRESLALDPTVDGPTMSLSQSRENEVNSELAIIKSRLLAERVVDQITPERFLAGGSPKPGSSEDDRSLIRKMAAATKSTLRSAAGILMNKEKPTFMSTREEAIEKMVKNLYVEVQQKSNVVTLLFESSNPQFGQTVLQTFLAIYQDHHIQVHSTHAPPQFFEEQSEKLMDKLREKENNLETFRAANNISAITIQKENLFSRISDIKREIAEVNSQISASEAQNASIAQALKGRSRDVELGRVAGRKSNTTDAIKARLFDFRIKEADLSARYPDNHRELMEVREQVRLAEAALGSEKQGDEITTGIDPTYQAMQLALETGRAQLQAQIARRQTLAEDLKNPQDELAALSKNEIVEARLKRDVTLLENEYLQYRGDMQRTNISRAMDVGKVSNLSIIQPATVPLDPVRPKKLLSIGIGFFLALFGAVCLAFSLEYFDDSLNTKEDVEKRLGLPVLASVPCKESRLCI